MDKRGFTLVELVVVMAVGAILLAIAVPGYAFLLNSSRLAAVTNDLVTTLHLARSEAIKRGARVTVCMTANAGAAAPACDSTAKWHDGWLLFVDNGVRGVIDPGDALLYVQTRAPSAARITSYNYARYISYLPNGRSQGSNNFPNGTIEVCVAGSRRDIIINSTGRPRLFSGTC